ncbi:MAG: hypothetical protein ABIU07_01600 [Ramlibacter sp.]
MSYLSVAPLREGTFGRCEVTRSFIPDADADYEASFTQGGSQCQLNVSQRQPEGKPPVSVNMVPVGDC